MKTVKKKEKDNTQNAKGIMKVLQNAADPKKKKPKSF